MLTLMNQSLSKYAVNCFLRAGYDNSSAITQMVTDEGPGNTLDQIEGFILKYYSTDMSCYPSTIVENECSSQLVQKFVFPPGHQVLISNFVNSIKADCNRKKRCHAGMCGDQLSPAHAKRKRVISAASYVAAEPPNAYDIESISNEIRKRIVKWQRKQIDDNVTKLKEHIHYKVNCKLNNSNCLDVHVYCEICNKKYKLQQKNEASGSSTVMISNWTSHIKKCVKEREASLGKGKQVMMSRLLTSMQLSAKLDDYSPSQYKNCPLINDDMFAQYPPLELPSSWSSWFTIRNITNVSYVQDTVHLGVKLKARLLTYSQILPLGKYSAQPLHLSLLQA